MSSSGEASEANASVPSPSSSGSRLVRFETRCFLHDPREKRSSERAGTSTGIEDAKRAAHGNTRNISDQLSSCIRGEVLTERGLRLRVERLQGKDPLLLGARQQTLCFNHASEVTPTSGH